MMERVVNRQRTDHDGNTLKRESMETAGKDSELEEEVQVYKRVE